MRHALLLLMLVAVGLAGSADATSRPGGIADLRIAKGQRNIAEAWLADPTTRYQHFVLGSRYEAASLVVRLRDGRTLKLTLPESSVFEDREPRLADLDGDGRDEIVVVRAHQDRGAALAVASVVEDRLVIIAETPPTGRRHTWLNPAGIADFDGDGKLDIAYVQMPHVLGMLRLWTLREGKLVQLASLPDFSNHALGSPDLGLASVADFDGDGVEDLAIPSLDRRTLRFVRFKGGARELKRVPLGTPAVSNFVLEWIAGRPVVVVGQGGKRVQRVDFRAVPP